MEVIMTKNINLTSTATATVVPEGITASRAAAAVLASEVMASALLTAKGAAEAAMVKHFGADVTSAAVRLAKRAADELAGTTKSRGGARADVLAVLATVEGIEDDTLTAKVFVAAARARLDANAAYKRDRASQKSALAKVVNDSSASLDERAAALGQLDGMETQDGLAKDAALVNRLDSVLDACFKAGMTGDTIHAAWHAAMERAAMERAAK